MNLIDAWVEDLDKYRNKVKVTNKVNTSRTVKCDNCGETIDIDNNFHLRITGKIELIASGTGTSRFIGKKNFPSKYKHDDNYIPDEKTLSFNEIVDNVGISYICIDKETKEPCFTSWISGKDI